MKVIVTTCDKYTYAVQGFAYLFNKYWSELQPVTVLGYKTPDFSLPQNFEYISLGKDPGYEDWTTGIIKYLQHIDDDYFVLLLEDYWLCRGVNHQAIQSLYDLCHNYPQILRFDLTSDRQYNGHALPFHYLPYWGYLDLLWTPPDSEYQMSLQAGIWNRKHLLDLLIPGKSIWDIEIGEISNRIHNRPDLWVLGTRQCPMRYANVFKNGKQGELILDGLTDEDKKELKQLGYLGE